MPKAKKSHSTKTRSDASKTDKSAPQSSSHPNNHDEPTNSPDNQNGQISKVLFMLPNIIWRLLLTFTSRLQATATFCSSIWLARVTLLFPDSSPSHQDIPLRNYTGYYRLLSDGLAAMRTLSASQSYLSRGRCVTPNHSLSGRPS